LGINRMQEQDSDRKDIEANEQQAGSLEQDDADEPVAGGQSPEMVEETELGVEADPADEPGDVLADGLAVREVVEAMLFATDSPLPAGKIAQVLEHGTGRQVRKHIQQLNEGYEQAGAAFRIEEVAGGYQILTLAKFQPWVARLLRARQESRLSPTQMETLAIIAYKQPVLRADVEAIRGVAAGDVINRLRELGMVKIVGRAEDVGRPLLYGTTKKFLRVFGLGSLEDLPRVEELKAPERLGQQQKEEERGEPGEQAPADEETDARAGEAG
jgi:segregation and condensation protein B